MQWRPGRPARALHPVGANVSLSGACVTDADVARIPVGNFRVPRAEFGRMTGTGTLGIGGVPATPAPEGPQDLARVAAHSDADDLPALIGSADALGWDTLWKAMEIIRQALGRTLGGMGGWKPVEPGWTAPPVRELADLMWLAYGEYTESGSAWAGGVVATGAWVRGGRAGPVTERTDAPVTRPLAETE